MSVPTFLYVSQPFYHCFIFFPIFKKDDEPKNKENYFLTKRQLHILQRFNQADFQMSAAPEIKFAINTL